MADQALSTTRRALLGAAAALPIAALSRSIRAEPVATKSTEGLLLPSLAAQAEWTTRLTRYRHLAARAKAAAETGWFRAANDAHSRTCANANSDRKVAFARLSRAEDLYWRRCTEPMQEAAVVLVLTPAPGLEALRDKLAAIRRHRLHEDGSMERDCIEVLEEDVERMAN